MRIVFFALWVPAAVLAALVVARLAWRETRAPLVAVLAGVIAAAGLVALPRTVDDAASAARQNRRFDAAQSHRRGGPEDCLVKFITCVNGRVWEELARLIPADDSYYVQADSGRIRFFTYTSLLPRVATQHAHAADWVVSYRHNPATLGLRYSHEWKLGPVAAKGRDRGVIVLAKVAK